MTCRNREACAKKQIDEPDEGFIKSKSALLGLLAVPVAEHELLKKQLNEKKELSDSQVDQLKQLQADYDEKKKQLAELQDELKANKLELDQLKGDLADTKKELDAKVAVLADTEKELSSHKTSLTDTKNELDTHKSTLADTQKELNTHKAILADSQKELDAHKITLADSQKELDAHKADLQSKNAELESVKAKFDDDEHLKEHVASRGMVLSDSVEHDKLQTDYASKVKDVEVAQLALADKEKQIESLKSLLESKDAELESLKKLALESKVDTPYMSTTSSPVVGPHVPSAIAGTSAGVAATAAIAAANSGLPEDYRQKGISSLSLSSETECIVVKSKNSPAVHPVDDALSPGVSRVGSELDSAKASLKSIDPAALPADKDLRIKDLQHRLDAPTTTYLGEKATAAGLVLIPATDYENFLDAVRSLDHTKDKVEPVDKDHLTSATGFAAGGVLGLAASSLSSMKKSMDKPPVDYLINNLKKMGYTSIPKSQYDSLLKTANDSAPASPIGTPTKNRSFKTVETVDTLKKKCADMGLVALSTSSYDSLIVSSKRSLTTVELIDRIEKAGMVALTKESYLALLDAFSSLGASFAELVDKLKNTNSTEFHSTLTELKALIENQNKIATSYEAPSHDYINEKASGMGYKVITLHDYASLKETHPTVENSTELLEANNFKVIPNDEYEKLLDASKKVEKPDHSFVSNLAAATGLSVLATADHDKLKERSISGKKAESDLQAKTAELQNVSGELAIVQKNLADTKQQLSEKEKELAQVKEEVENPSAEYIKSKAVPLGLVALLAGDHAAQKKALNEKEKELSDLNNQLEDPEFVKTRAVAHGFAPASAKDYDDLQEKLNGALADLEDKNDELEAKNVVLDATKADLQSLMDELNAIKKEHENPDNDYIKRMSTGLGLVALPVAEHASLQKTLTAKGEEVEKLEADIAQKDAEIKKLEEELAERQALVASLNKQLDEPDVEYLKSKSTACGLVAIPIAEQKELSKAITAKTAEVEKLESQISTNEEELQAVKSELSEKQIALTSLNKQLEEPDAEYVKSKSQSHGLVAIPLIDHEKLTKSLDTKSTQLEDLEAQIAQKTAELEKAKTELAENQSVIASLNKKLEEPDADYVKSKSDAHGLIAIPMNEHRELSASVNEKNAQIDSLTKKIDEPEAEYLKAKSEVYGLVTVPSSEYVQMRDTLSSKESELQESQNKLNVQVKELEEAKAELANVKQQLLEARHELDDDVGHFVDADSPSLAATLGVGVVPALTNDSSKLDDVEKQLRDKLLELQTVEKELDAKQAKLQAASEDPESSSLLGSVVAPVAALGVGTALAKSVNTVNEKDNSKATETLDDDDEYDNDSKTHSTAPANITVAELSHIQQQLADKDLEIADLKSQLTEPKKKDAATLGAPGAAAVGATGAASLQKTLSDKNDEIERLRNELELAKKASAAGPTSSSGAPLSRSSAGNIPTDAVLIEELAAIKAENDLLRNELTKSMAGHSRSGSTTGAVAISADQLAHLKDELASKDSENQKLREQLAKSAAIASGVTTGAVSTSLSKSVDAPESDAHLTEELAAKNAEIEQLKKELALVQTTNPTNVAGAAGVAAVSMTEFAALQKELASKDALISDLKSQLPVGTPAGSSRFSNPLGTTDAFTDPSSSKGFSDNSNPLSPVNPFEYGFSDLDPKKSFNDSKRISNPLGHGDYSSGQNGLSPEAFYEKDQQIADLTSKIEHPSKDYLVEKLAVFGYSASKDVPPARVNHSDASDLSSIDDLRDNPTSSSSVFVDAMSNLEHSDYEDEQDDLFDSVSPAEEDKLRDQAKKLGFALVPINEDDDGDVTSVEDDVIGEVTDVHVGTAEIQRIRPDTGTRPVSTRASAIPPELRESEIHKLKASGAVLGMEVITVAEYNRLKDAEHPSINKLKEMASPLGASVVEKPSVSNRKSMVMSDSSDATQIVTKESLQRYAADLGLVVYPKVEIDRLKRHSITSQELVSKAAELNLALVSEEDARRATAGLTREGLAEEARLQGLLCIPESQFIATTVSRKPDIQHVVVLPSTYYNKLLRSHEFYKANKTPLPTPNQENFSVSPDNSNMAGSIMQSKNVSSVPPTPIVSTMNGNGFNSPSKKSSAQFSTSGASGASGAFVPQKPGVAMQQVASMSSGNQFSFSELERRPDSIAGSLHTVHTVITNKREMIAAITQTIIGEYLFKYFRKLGPLSSLSESRHERFFWIHPYSLTLYWSSSNPVLTDPAANKIKALAIVSVEAVDDNNPLPPGLHYQSIIVRSADKSVKITCPTRQRHNIWYNSLKYLIERSTDDLVDDSDAFEDQYNESFSLDQKVEIERSQTFRHTQPRKSILHGTHLSQRSISAPIATQMAPTGSSGTNNVAQGGAPGNAKLKPSRSFISTIITHNRNESV
ncbi:unnamed protein product [Ambrosiozyma monospora]|uniref:Unnamed protein product n=1 Tax=Ambrosiozyma monospora TaxID=43982 RepID=A0A9W6YTB5_AMBMO|nr:unnamed protein product [Ambrosiozyma monospora]